MQNRFLHKAVTALIMAALLTTSFVLIASATTPAAPVVQELRAQEVQGTLPGGEFAKIWLGLEPETSGAEITLISEWDVPSPADKGINFYILNEQGLARIGDEQLSSIALGAGSANFVLNGPDNVLGASFGAVGLANYTVVVANDSNQAASFTLRVTNGFIIDGSDQVTDPNATTTEASDDTAAEGDTEETDADNTETPAASTAVTTTATTTDTAVAEPTATATTTDTTTSTATTTTTETVAMDDSAMMMGGMVRTDSLSGSLPEQNDQHFLGLEANGRDVQVTLRLTFEPQDNSELARRLNFWVIDPSGFNQFMNGSDPSDVAIAAGNRVFRGQDNERVASFQMAGADAYTIIVYNNATVAGTYQLTVENGVLIDDAGQTNESMSSGTGLSATGTTTGTTAVTGTVDSTTTTTTTPAATTTTATRTGEPGGTYVVQSGDTLALIARDIYGDLSLYESLCAFNNIANCNVIEVGDEIQLPTQAQISAGATAPATTTTSTATTATTTTAADDDAAADDTAATETDTADATDTADVDATDTMTATEESDAADDTAAEETTTGDSASSDTIFQTLVDNGNFTTLVNGLEATGLDATLSSSGSEVTLFAPTDAAFVTLRNRFSLTEEQLLGLPELADVLQYHVVDGSVGSSDLSDGMSVATVQGGDITVGISGDTVTLNGTATLIATDVETANGIIHVIDTVILPPTE